ncbi:MAG: ATP-binding cassette domain-containing protein [Conexivisphaerales archaeon]|jgi:ABC-2 type transport system ATP-binding protein
MTENVLVTPDRKAATNVLVSVEGLTKSFNAAVKAVDSVSFQIYEGEIFGFLGPNGAGKSTTINMLTTILTPTSGTATICGFDIVKDAMEVRRSVGVVPQEYTADEDLSGIENVLLCADLYGIPRSVSKPRANELLSLVELDSAAKRKVDTYSGGMRRRLELACGLISRPRLLFLDEPTLGLDVQTRTAVWDYIKKLKAEYNMTLFMTTHYLEEADAMCDRIAIIDQGKILKMGTPKELKDSLGGDVIEIAVKEDSEDLSSILSKVSLVKEVKKEDHTYRIMAELGEEAAPEIIEAVRDKGLHISRISVTKPTLDEVYLAITGRRIRDEQANWEDTMSTRMTMSRARR